ncbi:MAG: hypothetical protein V9E98_16020 [Candidatus Nanopelagicales bacterium]
MIHPRLALGLAGSVIALAGLTACSSTSSTTTASSAPATSAAAPTAAPTIAEPTTASGYSAETEKNFVDACTTQAAAGGMTQAAAKSLCGCWYRGIEQTVPFEDFLAADQDAATGAPVPDDMIKIGEQCESNPSVF